MQLVEEEEEEDCPVNERESDLEQLTVGSLAPPPFNSNQLVTSCHSHPQGALGGGSGGGGSSWCL